MDDSARDSLYFLENAAEGTPDSVVMHMDMPGWSNTFGTYFQTIININSKNKLIVKADNYLNSSLAEMTMRMHFFGQPPEPAMYLQTWPDIKRNVTGLYIGNSTTLSRKIAVTLNFRADYIIDKFQSSIGMEQFSVFNYKLEPKYSQLTKGLNLNAQYHIFKPVIFSLQTGISERIPTITERYGFYLYNAYDGYDYIGNPSLKTEKTISARFSMTYFNQGVKINFSQSFNYLTDYIMGITDTIIPPMNFYTNGLRVFSNIPGATIYGSELQVMYKPGGGFTFFLQGKFTWGQIYSGDPLPLIPPFKNVISVSYDRGRWSFQADNETAFSQHRINLNYGETTSPGYTLFNIKANMHFMIKGSMFDFSAGITNLLNAWYYEHLDWGHIPRPGRSFNIFLKYTY
jgi:iron complex outermembrane receptor protein